MSILKHLAAFAISLAFAFAIGLATPVWAFGAYAPTGPFGLYYGVSDLEAVLSMVIMSAVLMATLYASMRIVQWSESR
jgi:uncharacterized membrane protein